MGDIDGGTLDLVDHALNLGTHGLAGLAVQVGQGLVHQQQLGLADDGPGDVHPLLLAAGELDGHLVQQVVDLHQGGDLPHPAVDLCLVHPLGPEVEGHIVIHGQRGVHGVVLKGQADVAVLGVQVVHPAVPDVDVAVGDVLQTGDHPQGSGLAAAGGAQKGHEFALLTLQVQVLYGEIVHRLFLLAAVFISLVEMA